MLNGENRELSTTYHELDKGNDPEKAIASSPEKGIKYLSEAEIKAILSAPLSAEDGLLFRMGFDLGARASEIARPTPKPTKDTKPKPDNTALRWSNVRFKEQQVIVWDEKKDVYRVCQLSKGSWKLLKAYSKSEEVIARRRHDDRVFPFSTRTLNRRLKEWCKEAGIEHPVHWHMMRHSYVVHSIRAGRDWRVIAQQTGDRVSTLMKTYSFLSLEDTQEMIDKHPLLGGLI
jgi:integrase